MCFDYDSAPPIPRLAGAAVEHEDLVLTSADGTDFAAFLATPEQPGAAGVVILPDIRGLYRFYEELALRFAERGITAIAFDYFGRTAGVEKRDEDFEWMPHVQQTDPAKIQEDVEAAADRLREAGVTRVFTVGFCFGGRHSWLAASAGHDLAGAVGFYGRPGDMPLGAPSRSPIDAAGDLQAPILGLMGGADEGIPVESVREYERALDAAGAGHEMVVYDGAPHSFFDRKQAEFAEASEDAWQRTLAFVQQHA
jgi:carboxymethylenebutenolidase